MATSFGIVGRATQGPSIWSGTELGAPQVEEARIKIKQLYGQDAFKNGVYDTSDDRRNIEVAGDMKAMGLDAGQMAEITGVDAGTINRFLADNVDATNVAGDTFRELNPNLFPGASKPGIVSRPISDTTVSSAPVERIGAPTKWDVTADQTVQGQIQKILDPNNPLMVQARTTADEEWNRRGLVNSGMAATGAQDVMLRAAIPIATSDAATYSKAAGYNTDQQNQVASKNTEMANTVGMANMNANNSLVQANLAARTQMDQARLNADTQLEQTRMQAESQRVIAQLNSDTQKYVNQLDAATKLQAQQMQDANQTLLNSNQQAASMFNQAMVSMANIQNNQNLDAANKTQAIAQVWGTLQTQVKVLSRVTGLNLNLDFAGFPGFNDQGVFVGVGNEGGAPSATPAPTATPSGAGEPGPV